MKSVDVIKVYNLVDSKGNKLRLCFGVLENFDHKSHNPDKGYRWSFVGSQIPMPVRSGTWFNGFPENIMLNWLKGNGWYVHTCVNMYNGRARVYKVPMACFYAEREIIDEQP